MLEGSDDQVCVMVKHPGYAGPPLCTCNPGLPAQCPDSHTAASQSTHSEKVIYGYNSPAEKTATKPETYSHSSTAKPGAGPHWLPTQAGAHTHHVLPVQHLQDGAEQLAAGLQVLLSLQVVLELIGHHGKQDLPAVYSGDREDRRSVVFTTTKLTLPYKQWAFIFCGTGA